MQRVPESVWNKVGLRHIKQAHVCQKLPARMNMWCTQQSNTIIFCFLNLLNTLEHLSNKQEHGKKKKKSKIGSENFSRLGSPELVHPISRNQKSKNWIISGIDHWASPADGRIPLKPPGYQERGKQQHDISSYRNPEETQAELCAGHVGEMIINKQNHEQTLGKSPFSIPNEKADFSNQTLIL